MKKSFILHAIWLSVAVIAFLYGRTSTQSAKGPEDSAIEVKRTSKSLVTRASKGSEAGKRPGLSLSGTRGTQSRVTISQFLNERDPLVANQLFAELILSMDASNAQSIFEDLRKRRGQTH